MCVHNTFGCSRRTGRVGDECGLRWVDVRGFEVRQAGGELPPRRRTGRAAVADGDDVFELGQIAAHRLERRQRFGPTERLCDDEQPCTGLPQDVPHLV